MIEKISLVLFLATFLLIPNGFAAQSSDDVTSSPEMKDTIRKKILDAREDQSATLDEYIIGHGDIINVTIFEEGDMAASATSPPTGRDRGRDSLRPADGVQVRMDGRISLKHVGDVKVIGMTLTELANFLKELYAVIFSEPILTTTLVQSNSLRYTVIGNVVEPGIYFLDYPMTLVQTIARSGGFTEWTDRTLTLVRENLDNDDKKIFKNNTLKFDYDHFVSGKNLKNNIFIKSGDVINVN